jgi:hypothetical protein
MSAVLILTMVAFLAHGRSKLNEHSWSPLLKQVLGGYESSSDEISRSEEEDDDE